MSSRFDRQQALFGAEGQKRLVQSRVAVIGAGGLGSFVAMELAYLGIGRLVLIDEDRLESSNRNRLVGAWHSHADGTPKVEILASLIHSIDPSIEVEAVESRLETAKAITRIQSADFVIGCLDSDGARLRLNAICMEANTPLLDAATDTPQDGDALTYGGRVTFAARGRGCLMCLGVLDPRALRVDLATKEQRADESAIYGVDRKMLGRGGPAVISINGVVASLAVTELMVAITGLRDPHIQLEYRGRDGVVFRNSDKGDPGCYFCGSGEG